MKQIRQFIFETNSSSSHSISISESTDGILDTIEPVDGVIRLPENDFGWEWKRYNDPLTKASYCAIHANWNDAQLEMLKEVICEHTGAKAVVIGEGSIDHNSAGNCAGAFESKETLKNFIFNPKSILFTGNDNDGGPPNFYDPLDTEYHWQLEIEGIDLVEKFTEKPSKKNFKYACRRILEQHPACSYLNYSSYEERFDIKEPWMKTDTLDSFAKYEQNVIVLFRTKPVYSAPPDRKYLRKEVMAEKELKFKLVKI